MTRVICKECIPLKRGLRVVSQITQVCQALGHTSNAECSSYTRLNGCRFAVNYAHIELLFIW